MPCGIRVSGGRQVHALRGLRGSDKSDSAVLDRKNIKLQILRFKICPVFPLNILSKYVKIIKIIYTSFFIGT